MTAIYGERIATDLTSNPLHHELTHTPGISLTTGRLHDRTHNRASRLDLAASNLLGNIGLSRQGLIDGGQKSRIVRNDLESTRLDDCARPAFACQHAVKHLAGQLVGQPPGIHQALQLGHLLRRYRQLLKGDLTILGCAGSPIHHLRAD